VLGVPSHLVTMPIDSEVIAPAGVETYVAEQLVTTCDGNDAAKDELRFYRIPASPESAGVSIVSATSFNISEVVVAKYKYNRIFISE